MLEQSTPNVGANHQVQIHTGVYQGHAVGDTVVGYAVRSQRLSRGHLKYSRQSGYKRDREYMPHFQVPADYQDQYQHRENTHNKLTCRQDEVTGYPVSYCPGEEGQDVRAQAGCTHQPYEEGGVGQGEQVPAHHHRFHLRTHSAQCNGTPHQGEVALAES